MMKSYLISICLLLGAVMLSACSSMNGSFDCPNRAGVSCRSLDQINGMVNSGQIRGRTSISSNDNEETLKEFDAYPNQITYMPGAPLRYGETVQRIWIAPFEDTEGNYHQDSLMYSVIKGGHWIGSPVTSIQSS